MLAPVEYRIRLEIHQPDCPTSSPELKLQGTGSISGFARNHNDPSKPWKFADGSFYIDDDDAEPYLQFKTDAEGRFHVDGIPLGTLKASLRIAPGGGIVWSIQRRVRIVQNQTTQLRFEGSKGNWTQPILLRFGTETEIPNFAVGREVSNVTTREPIFRFEARPLGNDPATSPIVRSLAR
jgi:hypothetical protein